MGEALCRMVARLVDIDPECRSQTFTVDVNLNLSITTHAIGVERAPSSYGLLIKLNRFVIEGLVFELWCDLLTQAAVIRALRLPSVTKLSTTVYIMNRRLYLR